MELLQTMDKMSSHYKTLMPIRIINRPKVQQRDLSNPNVKTECIATVVHFFPRFQKEQTINNRNSQSIIFYTDFISISKANFQE